MPRAKAQEHHDDLHAATVISAGGFDPFYGPMQNRAKLRDAIYFIEKKSQITRARASNSPDLRINS